MQVSIEALMELRGAHIVSLRAETVPEMVKRDNPWWGRVRKVSRVNGVINWIYENAVNRGREREGKEPDFSAFPRAWGVRLIGTPLVFHKGNHYLEVKVQMASAIYLDEQDQEVPEEVLRPFFKAKSPGRQGLDRPVILRDYRLDHIKELTWGGQTYQVAA